MYGNKTSELIAANGAHSSKDNKEPGQASVVAAKKAIEEPKALCKSINVDHRLHPVYCVVGIFTQEFECLFVRPLGHTPSPMPECNEEKTLTEGSRNSRGELGEAETLSTLDGSSIPNHPIIASAENDTVPNSMIDHSRPGEHISVLSSQA